MSLAVGLDKIIENSHYANGKLFAGFPCKIGHNAGILSYYQLVQSSVDLVTLSGDWRDETGSVTYDSDGWITALTGSVSKILVHDTSDYVAGNYTIQYAGTAIISVRDRTLTSVAANKYTFDLPEDAGVFKIWVTFSGTGAETVSSLSCYLTAEESDFSVGKVFRQDFIDFFANNSTIRFMDLMGTNASTNNNVVRTENYSTWSQNIPPEGIAELANATSVNPWVCIPHQATNAYVTAFFTRLNARLDAGLSVYVEYSNEIWNYAFPFSEQTSYVYYNNSPTIDAPLSTGITHLVAHGMTTGDAVRMFITEETGRAAPWALGNTMYAVVRTVDTLEFAETFTESQPGTEVVASPLASMTFVRFKKMVGYTFNSQQGHDNYTQRSREIWAIADSILTRARCVHITGVQATNAGGTTSPRMDATQEAATDFVAIAPYVKYTSLTDWELSTDQELLEDLEAQYDSKIAQVTEHRSYTNSPIICYEGGDETFPAAGAEKTKAEEFYDSPHMVEFYKGYGQMLANAHVQEICFYRSHTGLFGTQSEIGETTTKKWTSIQPYLSLGFTRG